MGGIKIHKNVFYNTLLSVSQVLFPLITFPYVTRILGPEGLGAVNFVDSITQYLILFAALGIPLYGIREIAKVKNSKENLSKVFSELFFLHLSLTIILCLIYVLLFSFIPKLYHNRGLFWIGSVILFVSVFPSEWFFQGMEKFSLIAVRAFLIRILSIVLLFLWVRKPTDTALYYGITLLSIICNSLVNIYFLRREITLSFKNLNIKRHLGPLVYIFSSNVAISVYVLLDSILLGFLRNTEEVGFYTTPLKLNRVLLALLSAFSMVMLPRLAAAFSEKRMEEARALLTNSYRYVILLSIPVGVGLLLFSSDIVLLFAGNAFQESVIVLKITSFLMFLIGLSNIFGMQVLIPIGKEKVLLKTVSIGMFLSIGLNFFLIPFLGYIGAAVTNVLTELVVTFVSGYFAFKYVRFRFSYKVVVVAIICCLPFYPIMFLFSFIQMNFAIKLVATIICCGLAYFASQLWIFRNPLLLEGKTVLMSRLKTLKK
ncbi:flippase [Chitinophaga varians]|uniref:Flippase n=1 Tax=Chitinophaga varians TaxID=2202339 RepID=A0A847RWB4_9BACT|nr:flippase [Chitinophaga varians]NLR65285.1 flippase [Chitinophaga varians]